MKQKPIKKKFKILKIVLAIIVLLWIILIAIDEIPYILPNRLVCRSAEGSTIIKHNGYQITGYRSGFFNIQEAQNRVDEIGLDAFLDEFAEIYVRQSKRGECRKR